VRPLEVCLCVPNISLLSSFSGPWLCFGFGFLSLDDGEREDVRKSGLTGDGDELRDPALVVSLFSTQH
jgi:hypothetical protein